MDELLSFALLSFSSLIIIVNPLGAMLVYSSLTEGMDSAGKREVAVDACRVAFVILMVFAIGGNYILQIFGITINAFRIAGGLLLFGIGIEMVNAKISRTKLTEAERYESLDADEVGLVPLAIPMIAGPGSIATVVVLASGVLSTNPHLIIIVVISLILTILITYLVLINAETIISKIGKRENRVISRLMGILLIAIAVQLVITGLSEAFPMLVGV